MSHEFRAMSNFQCHFAYQKELIDQVCTLSQDKIDRTAETFVQYCSNILYINRIVCHRIKLYLLAERSLVFISAL